MKYLFINILSLLILLAGTTWAQAADEEITIFNDPEWFPVNEQAFNLSYEVDEAGYTNKSLQMETGANDINMYLGGSLDYMQFSSDRAQFALYGHIGYRPKWRVAPYIQGGVDLYSTLVELIAGNRFRLSSRISAGVQVTMKDSYVRFFYRSSNLDYNHFDTENGAYTSYGVSFGSIIGRSKRWRKNPPVVTYNTYPY